MAVGEVCLAQSKLLDVGRWGTIEFTEDDGLLLRASWGQTIRFRLWEPLPREPLSYWVNSTGDRLLFLTHEGRAVYFLDIPGRRLDVVATIPRFGEGGFHRVRLADADGGVLVVWEQGLMYVEPSGRPRWRVDHERADWFFTAVDQGCARYESAHEDEGTWGYQLADGARVEAPQASQVARH